MVETEAVVLPSSSSLNARADPKQKTTPTKRRGNRPSSSSDKNRKHVHVPAQCGPALQQLKKQLGLRSDGEAVVWLVRQVRPDLLPTKPLPTHSTDSLPICSMHLPNERPPVSSSRPPVRATVVQASTLFFDNLATLDKVERLVSMAASRGSQLVVFPEAFVGGYPRCMALEATALLQETDSAISIPGPEVERLSKIAEMYKVHLVLGVVERADLYLYTTVLFFDSQGQLLGHCRKRMPLESEGSMWFSGEKLLVPVFETSIGKIGLICWDANLLTSKTELYDKGVEIYCAPSANVGDEWVENMSRIALEGGCFVLSAIQLGSRRDYPTPPEDSIGFEALDATKSDGGCVIISPSGTFLAGPNHQGECLISADIDFGEINIMKKD